MASACGISRKAIYLTSVAQVAFRNHRWCETSNRASFRIDASMRHKVTLLPGEGIGPEVAVATRKILDAAGVDIEWEELGARAENTDKSTVKGEVLNEAAIAS